MKKLILLLVFWFVSVPGVLAAGFRVDKVGSMDLGGLYYDNLWYSNPDVVFSGVALANEAVNCSFDGEITQVVADGSGNWSCSKTFTEGDHEVNFAAESGSVVAFTLSIGAPPADLPALTTATQPAAGNIQPTLILLGLGAGFYLLGNVFKKVSSQS